VLNNARSFLSTVIAWPNQGETAYCNIHWRSLGQNDRFFWDGRAVTNVDDAVKTLNWALKQQDIKDLYVCMSLQSACEEKQSKRGYPYKKAVRAAGNALLLKSLFIDIDVKADAYETTGEALKALKEFISKTNMPKPSAVVGSGSGGFHVHWALDQPLPRDEWQVLANALQRATAANELICDSQCTVDAARILRVPETFNNKTEIPREVKLLAMGNEVSLDEVRSVLSGYIQAKPVSSPDNDELGAGLESKAKPMKINDVARACGFIKRTLETGGAANDQPLWFLTGSIASFMEDGREALHRMSSGHATYDEAKTDELYDRVLATRKARDVGWPKCEKIASYGCGECATCPLAKQSKSPLNFAIREANDQVVEAPLPKGYIRGNDNRVYRNMTTETGEVVSLLVSHYPFGEAYLTITPVYTLHFITATDRGDDTLFELPCEVIYAKDGLGKYLGAKGFFVPDNQIKLVREFFMAWVTHLQNKKSTVISNTPYGWTVDNGRVDGFAYNGRVWMKDGDRPSANAMPALGKTFKVTGDPKPWRELVSIINAQGRPALDALISVGFAAPLVAFTGESGCMVNAFSSASGVGKSTAMKAGMAVWAQPKNGRSQLDDTEVAAMLKVGQLRNLPLMWDEFQTEQQTQKFAKIAFSVTSGRERNRGTADAQLRISGDWQTMLSSCANYSMIDHVAREMKSTTAGLYRCFEFEVEKAAQANENGHVMRLTGLLENNHGHAGLEYAQFLGANYERIDREVAEMSDYLWKTYKFKEEERFWNVSMTVLILGAQYANELGLTTFDMAELKEFLVKVLGEMRKAVEHSPSDLTKDVSMSAILGEYLSVKRARNTLVTNRVWRFKGRPKDIKVLNDTSKLDDITVQRGKEDGYVTILAGDFSKWMAERGYSRHAYVKRMTEDFGLEDTVGNLGSGTEFVRPKDRIYYVCLHDPKLKDFME
jgi:hypothetical protein